MVDEIELNEIKVKIKSLRISAPIDDLIESIKAVGLIQPLVVNSNKELICGGRRYAALKKLKWKKVPVFWIEKSTLDQEIAHIDENLIRSDLKGADYDEAVNRRYDLYLEKYPETGKGRASKSANSAHLVKQSSFGDETARITGDSKRKIYSAIERSKKSSDAVKAAHKARKISDSQVQELIHLDKKEQEKLLPVVLKNKSAITEIRSLVNESKKSGVDAVVKSTNEFVKWRTSFEKIKRMSNSLCRELQCTNLAEITFPSIEGTLLWKDLSNLKSEILKFMNRHHQTEERIAR